MYIRKTSQLTISDDFFLPFGGKLNKNNRWIKLEVIIPWHEFEEKYASNFKPTNKGEQALSVRVALGALIIKTKMKLTDAEVPEMVMENPYLQFFLGYDGFEDTRSPFHSSLLTHFRKRLSPEVMMEINEIIANEGLKNIADKEKEQDESKDDDNDDQGSNGTDHSIEEIENELASGQISVNDILHNGKLILDATCAPSDIRYPTDLNLLNSAREKLEEMIDVLHAPDKSEQTKPRTYRIKARKEYLAIEKKRKKQKKPLRQALKKQLGYVKRDLGYIDNYLEEDGKIELLSKRQCIELVTIRKLYEQQQYMFDEGIHSVPDRIVSISQPHVRPIVRGKAGSAVEFGCKVATSVVNGYTFFENLNFDSFNEGTLLQQSVKDYYNRFGCLPEAVLADSIYRNRENLRWLKKLGIRISGPKLGRKPKFVDPEVKRIEREDSGERNAVEGTYGVGKRKYSLDLIKSKLEDTAKTEIVLQFLVMNLDHRLRFILRYFLKICNLQACSTKFLGLANL